MLVDLTIMLCLEACGPMLTVQCSQSNAHMALYSGLICCLREAQHTFLQHTFSVLNTHSQYTCSEVEPGSVGVLTDCMAESHG